MHGDMKNVFAPGLRPSDVTSSPWYCSDAKTDVKNDDGKIPIEVAQLNEQEAVVEILEKGKAAKPAKETNGTTRKPEESKQEESKQDVYL